MILPLAIGLTGTSSTFARVGSKFRATTSDLERSSRLVAGARSQPRRPRSKQRHLQPRRGRKRLHRVERRSQARRESVDRPVVSKSDQGTVIVDVQPPADPVLTLWREANEAYYRRRDLPEAVRLATRVVELGGSHAQMARQLLCDARIALEDGKAALKVCRSLLPWARSEEEKRNIHYTVGTIYRALLGDCAKAIQHYNQALVFGRQHILDDEVRIFRATCALEVGDISLAERDVGSLSARAGRLARPEEVTLLQRRLAAAKKKARNASVPND